MDGVRVRVPLGRRRVVGFVVSVSGAAAEGVSLKPIDAVMDGAPVVDAELLELTRWAADYYMASWGEVLACAVPSGGEPSPRRGLRLESGASEERLEVAVGRSARRRQLVDSLRRGALQPGELPRDAGRVAQPLIDAGLAEWFVPARQVIPAGPAGPPLVLNGGQVEVLQQLQGLLAAGQFAPCLLRGVTGSGKTEVYLRAAQAALDRGRTVLYLVPEIGLTPLLAHRFAERFGDRMGLLHSALGAGERARTWNRIRRGEATVVLGVRSAVFAPLRNLGLLVVDEEQDGSFKQEERPRYHARDLALVRGRAQDTVVVLGSATPSLESFHHASEGRYRLLELGGRVAGRPMASVEVVDMRRECSEGDEANGISRRLRSLLQERLEGGEQSILLLNRRGYATFILCRECGELVQCPSCSVSMVFHRGEGRLRCHYCDHSRGFPERCPSCKGARLLAGGEGTERLEENLAALFPDARLCRLDRDTVRRRGAAERLLQEFGRGEGDILLGTQMVAKGHDFPRVTLVGVLGAEATLGLPDFRAAERTFQLLTQVAGRAGRGDAPGHVVIQSFQPDHYAIRHARAQDYDAFYEEEMRFRRRLQYPPFCVLANLVVSRRRPDEALALAHRLVRALHRAGDGHLRVLGPAAAPLAKLRGMHRVQILVKARTRGRLGVAVRGALASLEERGNTARCVAVDIDPVSLL